MNQWNFLSTGLTALDQPSLSYVNFTAVNSVGCPSPPVPAPLTGSWNRILCPACAVMGHVTSTLWPFASSANGCPGCTPEGTTTSNVCTASGCLSVGGGTVAGGKMRTFVPGRAFAGQVTMSSLPFTSTRN